MIFFHKPGGTERLISTTVGVDTTAARNDVADQTVKVKGKVARKHATLRRVTAAHNGVTSRKGVTNRKGVTSRKGEINKKGVTNRKSDSRKRRKCWQRCN
jgi:hypothetical protein